jgi:hypothetical protein
MAQTSSDLAKQAQNPIANMISLPLQNNTNFNVGPRERTQNILNVQPILPFSLSEDWNLITRTILPITYISTGEAIGDAHLPTSIDDGYVFGLGDTTLTGWISPSKAAALTWGVGPVVLIPTSTDDVLGAGEWGAGISAIVLGMPGDWVVGSLLSNVWTAEEDDGSRAVNLFSWQPIINYNIPEMHGLYLTSVPLITANWEADEDNRWTVPVGGGVGKLFKLGKQPVNGQVSAYYNAKKPEFAADWQLRLQLQFLFPK